MALRIIGGYLKRKKLLTPEGRLTRPTTDRVRESLFNILNTEVQEAWVLDLFSGSGALGIEALSRGAAKAVLLDNDPAALTVIKHNIASCRLHSRTVMMQCDILQHLGCIQSFRYCFDLVFMDPPYARAMILQTLHNLNISGVVKEDALIVIEHSSREPIPQRVDHFSLFDQRKYGKTRLSFMRYAASSAEGQGKTTGFA
jgi:16S rRNA (guanine966-N2)-methyltransferase